MRFFFFGLLSDPEILNLVAGRDVPGYPYPPAHLEAHRLVRVQRETFPMLVAAPDARVPGVIVEGLNAEDLARINFFESVEYEPRPLIVQAAEGPIEALAFATTERAIPDQEPWTFQDWSRRFKAHDLREARLWMSFYGVVDVQEADRLYEEARAIGRTLEDLVVEVCGEPNRFRSRGG